MYHDQSKKAVLRKRKTEFTAVDPGDGTFIRSVSLQFSIINSKMMNLQNDAEYKFLMTNGRIGKTLGLTHFTHLEQPIGILNYIRIADDIRRQARACDLLDWGCGFGQLTYLLKRRGFKVTAFDIGEPGKSKLPDIPLCRDLNVVFDSHPTKLPFEDNTFDAVLSCGTLEHVEEVSASGNEIKSLHEIARVLRRKGILFIYQLPQRYAWQEMLVHRLKLGYSHPRRFTETEIMSLLFRSGFKIRRINRANLIPKNLSGMTDKVRDVYSRYSRILMATDAALCRLPGLKQFAGVLEITAQCNAR